MTFLESLIATLVVMVLITFCTFSLVRLIHWLVYSPHDPRNINYRIRRLLDGEDLDDGP
jgi:hypothetical protein